MIQKRENQDTKGTHKLISQNKPTVPCQPNAKLIQKTPKKKLYTEQYENLTKSNAQQYKQK